MTQHSIDRLAGRSVVLIGGGSGIGLAVARQAVAAGAHVHLGGRTETTLQRAAAELGDAASWGVVDTSDDASVARFFERVEAVDALLTTAASYTTGPFTTSTIEEARSPFESKFWGQYRVVHAALPLLTPDASVVLMSGAASVRPAGPAAAYVAANAAIEGL
ncbi:oxidoreductase, short chain dehydrogenase/reductase family protein, partial [Leifsonia aquatica ATCC 14665]